jgi:hypothetical protein
MPSLTRARRSTAPFRAAPPREISLLRTSVVALVPERPACVHCRRVPLVGELVHVYEAAGAQRHVCELCRPRHREPPARSEIVHSSEHHRAVKARTRAA